MKVKKLFEKKITKEMEDWFEKRTANHIKLVQKYCEKIENKFHDRYKGKLNDISKNHDESKFQNPERLPYIVLSWKHKSDDYKSYKDPGHIADKEIDKATLHHISNNKHHPEFWDSNFKKNVIVDATKMPDIYIAEMVADWLAMSEELGNSAKDWADKKVNVRWKFTEKQKELIYELIEQASIVSKLPK